MNRIYHTWDKWECYPAGFFNTTPPEGMTKDECREAYRLFLSDIPRFCEAMSRVIEEWPNSCEHNLTNEKMNRVAWMGQAAMCLEMGVPSVFRGGYMLLTKTQKEKANAAALRYINLWREKYNEPPLTTESVKSKTEANLY